MQQSLHLAMHRARDRQAQHIGQLGPLQVTQDLQRSGADACRAERRVGTFRPQDPTRHRGECVAHRLDLRTTFDAPRQLRPEAHGVQQVEFEPARDRFARDRFRGRVERRQPLRQEHEGPVAVRVALAETIRQLHQVPGLRRGLQVVPQPQVGVLDGNLGDDVEGPTDGQHQLDVTERLEPAAQP